MKKIIVLVLCFMLSGCASWAMFDAPEYWYKTNRAPNPNAPTLPVRGTPCGNDAEGCYWHGVKMIRVPTTPEAFRCWEAHENAHACGWDHPTDGMTPNSETNKCGYHIPRCK